MSDTDFLAALKQQLDNNLPGQAAQAKMASGSRTKFPTIPSTAKEACVLCLLYLKEKEWHLVLMERVSNNPNDRHSGQMSFPGGKLEIGETYEEGALRETEEEIGVPREDIKILGKLTPLYIPVSNFHVHPFVGVLTYTPSFIPQESEVKELVEVPISLLLDSNNRRIKDLTIRTVSIKEVPYFDVYKKVVWGATAMMLSEFVVLINNVKKAMKSDYEFLK